MSASLFLFSGRRGARPLAGAGADLLRCDGSAAAAHQRGFTVIPAQAGIQAAIRLRRGLPRLAAEIR